MSSARYGIRVFMGLTLGLGLACASPTETPAALENEDAEQPVACDSVTPTYHGYSRPVTDLASFHDFATTATIRRGVAGYLFALAGNAMPCVVTSPSGIDSCNRKWSLSPLEGTVTAYSDAASAETHCVARTETDVNGAYQLELEPGRYWLRLLDEQGFEKNETLFGFSGASTEPILSSANVASGLEITSFHLLEDHLAWAPAFR